MAARNRLALFSLLALTWTVPLLAQDPAAEEPKPDPELQDKLDRFEKAAADRKHERDAEATQVVDMLLRAYPKMHPHDQIEVVKSLGGVLSSSKIRRDPEERALFTAIAVALGEMGPEGARMLVLAYKSTKFDDRDWVAMRAVMLKSIGKTKDERQIDFLEDRAARDPEDQIMRAAGEALGNFDESDQRIRKDIAKELIKKYNEIDGKSRANLDPGDPQVKRAKEALAAISHDWNQTLSKLTGENFTTAAEWQHFYNKSKNDNWDAAKGKR